MENKKLIEQTKRFARALLALNYETDSDTRVLHHIEETEPVVKEALKLLDISSFGELINE